ncbi:MAG TPA: M3 family metallopeptidase [Xanthobacteraceae bacterium]|jgi:peptidyl-dipeptidase Dcp|nr:M3 family metallopeptidase [Xanthobacteraceae bacterium]
MTDASFPPPAHGDNPLLSDWTTPFRAPPFGAIRPEHFGPAFDTALARHRGEVAAIAAAAAAPTFGNTIGALERSGRALSRVSAAFFALVSAHSNDALLGIERDIVPRLAAHWDAIYMNQALFRRIEALRHDQSGLDAEEARVLDRYFVMFRRAGAGLDAAARRRLAEIGERLAVLGTQFSQRVLADEKGYTLPLATEDELAGLPEHVIAAAREAARERGLASPAAVTLARSSVEPFLQLSRRRDLREKAFRAWIARGEGGETDNRTVIAEMVRLRTEKARLLGYPTWAHYRLDDAMAKTPEAARGLLSKVWAPARRRALADRDAMQEMIRAEGGNFALAPWDWRYYAEKLRRERCDLGEGEIEPYLGLDRIIDAAFETARRLFGITVTPRNDVPVWHPDVRAWEVRAADGHHLGLFFGDYFARPSKRSGAWMATLREQDKLDGEARPLVFNVMNFAKGRDGEPVLISFDDARTLFHEFGHALHALLSDVTYPLISGTGVATDFVELPSQLYEHWLETPEILKSFATHHRTGEPMPDALIAKLRAARTFNQGFTTVEYVASAIVDLDFHSLEKADDLDPAAFERTALDRIGMPEEIVMRHRSPHFSHVFAGDHYSAAYYSYMWSEVLDADAFNAFLETGNVFDHATAERLLRYVYSAGGSRLPDAAYVAFRGRLPTEEALLKRRGLTEAATAP